MKSQRLPDTEFEIMTYIWDREPPVTTTMVMEALGRERGWKIQTVVTLFARLTERGFLRVERGSGRERAFYPIITREEYLRMETESFVEHYHRNSFKSLLTALESERLTESDLERAAAQAREAARIDAEANRISRERAARGSASSQGGQASATATRPDDRT